MQSAMYCACTGVMGRTEEFVSLENRIFGLLVLTRDEKRVIFGGVMLYVRFAVCKLQSMWVGLKDQRH